MTHEELHWTGAESDGNECLVYESCELLQTINTISIIKSAPDFLDTDEPSWSLTWYDAYPKINRFVWNIVHNNKIKCSQE